MSGGGAATRVRGTKVVVVTGGHVLGGRMVGANGGEGGGNRDIRDRG